MHAVPSRSYSRLKLAVFVLLILNTVIFATRGTLSEGLDSLAWFTLLALFELEITSAGLLSSPRALAAVHGVRLLAAAAVPAAAIGYVYDEAWLDAINAALWIAVVIMLEVEVRYPRLLVRCRTAFVVLSAALYPALAMMVFAWAWRGEWLAAYDAVLWLVAFVMIELGVLGASGRHGPRVPLSRAAS